LGDFTALKTKDEKIGNKALIVNILGYLDFNTKFLADSFERQGTICRISSVKLEEMERLRKNPSEMRATNIARVMDRDGVWEKAAEQVKGMLKDEDIVVLPAVFGLKDGSVIEKIREAIGVKTVFVSTMPPSVPGIRTQMTLKAEFERAGGRFLMGDTVVDADFNEDGTVKSIGTQNFGSIRLYADNFVIATGSFFSKGLIATPERIFEPVFGVDLSYAEGRDQWFDRNFWNKQNYISYGAKVSKFLHASIDGKPIANLYAIGSIIAGSNTLYEGCGGGIALLTALAAADSILEK
jgi:glycerol-3-phosphate dehydrogenase subunit B